MAIRMKPYRWCPVRHGVFTTLRHSLRVGALVLGGSLDALDALLNDLG